MQLGLPFSEQTPREPASGSPHEAPRGAGLPQMAAGTVVTPPDPPVPAATATTAAHPVVPAGSLVAAREPVVPAGSLAPARDLKVPAGSVVAGLHPVVFVRHRRARRYVLRVEGDGRVRVTIPRGGSRRDGEAFARRHLDWIARQRAALARSPADAAATSAARVQAREDLPQRLLELAARHGLRVTRVSIRNQRTRWGSCGRDGHITLNWRLLLMPDWVRDYVLVHELMHLRRMDHSPAYWDLVAAAYPRYEEARRWLRQHGPSLR